MEGLFRRRGAILAAIVLATALGVWFYAMRLPPIPNRPLRIGFERNPPVQIRTATGFGGLAVETVSEAAKRAGIQLQWVETGTSSDEAFEKGLVDLWPLMTDLPDRRKRLHFSRPWLRSSYALLVRAGTETPDLEFKGRIACFKMPLHVRILRERYPRAQVADFPTSQQVVGAVCKGTVAAAFLSGRVALAALRDKPHECDSTELRLQSLPVAIQLGVASTFEAARAAENIRSEIDNLFRDGTFAVTISKYSYYGLDDTWSTFNLMRAMEQARWMAWSIAALILALALSLWQASSLRRAWRTAEKANTKTSKALSRYEMVARATNDALMECDLENGTVTWNESVHVLFRYEADQVRSDLNWWDERVHPDDRERVSAGIRDAIAWGASTWSDEYRFRRGDGSYASVVDRGYLRYEGGKAVRLVRAIMDVTTQRSLETQLRQAQKMEAVGRLAGGVAHDFNNLLTVILGYGGLLDKELAPHDPCRTYVNEILGAGGHAASLTRQLLAFSRKQIFRPIALDLNQFIEDMKRMIQRLVGEDIAVETRPSSGLALVSADPDQISQILMNLAANARDAMPNGGRLIIRTANSTPHQAASAAGREDRPECVLLAVTDTGVGIPEENRQHLFEPFFTTKERGRGTGLGLSSVYGIVQQSDGWIDVQSEPGQGTTFSIYLPVIEGPAAIEPIPEPLTTTARVRASGTLLVVEDQEEVRRLMKAMLESEGFNVLAAAGGGDALSLARRYSETINLLITDVIMPDMTGKQLADQLAPMRPGMKVLYISGYSGDVLARRGVLEPDVAYLPKPFTPVTLSARVREILGPGAAAQNG